MDNKYTYSVDLMDIEEDEMIANSGKLMQPMVPIDKAPNAATRPVLDSGSASGNLQGHTERVRPLSGNTATLQRDSQLCKAAQEDRAMGGLALPLASEAQLVPGEEPSAEATPIATSGLPSTAKDKHNPPSLKTRAPSEPHSRQKVYCGKWLFEGVCAFTQQGCRFKHEMPHDKETQEWVGLRQGYPAWYKRDIAEQSRQRPTEGLAARATTGIGSNRVVTGTRQSDGYRTSSSRGRGRRLRSQRLRRDGSAAGKKRGGFGEQHKPA